MNTFAWNRFVKVRDSFKKEIERLERSLPGLRAVQQQLVNEHSPSYVVDTPIVYNNALDDIRKDSEIHLILVGDNPGRREQAAENRRYLVGPSGKIAERFFRDNPVLGIDFRENVIILNKTPVHTPRTADLRKLCRLAGPEITAAIDESQRFMARLLPEFHHALTFDGATTQIWITGYSEMRKKGIFAAYTEELNAALGKAGLKDTAFLFRHFSMNQFTIDLNKKAVPGEPLSETLSRIGTDYRKRFLSEESLKY